MAKLWFSLYDRGEYKGNDLAFYDTAKLDFSNFIEGNYPVIRQELENYLKEHHLQSYFNTTMVEKPDSWKTISLKSWTIDLYENYKHFPKTVEIIKSVDGLVSASFNLLNAGATIKPHCGDTNGIFRCHLGLEIPATMPECGFRVKEEWKSWEEGKLLVFVDANNHEAINLSNKNRFIFLFDVIRPEYRTKKHYISSTVIASLFLQKRAEAFVLLYKSPLWLQTVAGFLLVPFAFVAIRARNLIYYLFKK
ncbi:MAG: aspartyl/asparaginyl beta-hydroxylase domain-containing protein [Bacteroidota bacterium]